MRHKHKPILALFFSIVAFSIYAILPSSVYKKRIIASKTKVTAKIINVKITAKSKRAISKTVTFKLIKNYGQQEISTIFTATCSSAGENPTVGGTIYFYPKKDDRVFITASETTTIKNGSCGPITSLTVLTPQLEKALKEGGFKNLKINMSSVSPKTE